jgi:hypothetical protein
MQDKFSINPASQSPMTAMNNVVWWPRKPLSKPGSGKSSMGMAKGGRGKGKGGKSKKKGY